MMRYLLIAVSIALGAAGSLMLKARRAVCLLRAAGLGRPAAEALTTPLILGGFVCSSSRRCWWIFALRSVPLSTAYPMVALSYVIIFLGSAALFGESLGWRHWAGALLIVAGIVLIAWRNG